MTFLINKPDKGVQHSWNMGNSSSDFREKVQLRERFQQKDAGNACVWNFQAFSNILNFLAAFSAFLSLSTAVFLQFFLFPVWFISSFSSPAALNESLSYLERASWESWEKISKPLLLRERFWENWEKISEHKSKMSWERLQRIFLKKIRKKI